MKDYLSHHIVTDLYEEFNGESIISSIEPKGYTYLFKVGKKEVYGKDDLIFTAKLLVVEESQRKLIHLNITLDYRWYKDLEDVCRFKQEFPEYTGVASFFRGYKIDNLMKKIDESKFEN